MRSARDEAEAARAAGWRPEGSLSHPLFLAALALLALNDHVLKGGGLVPGWLTGKASDVAGLLVAPLALAWLLGVRTPRGWRLCHVAVGIGFAAVQVPALAAGLEEVGRGLGLPLRLWPDATDLWALLALSPSARWLGPRPGEGAGVEAGRPGQRAAGVAARAARRLVGVAGLALCTATSSIGEPPPRYPFPPAGRLRADVFVRHVGSEDLQLWVQRVEDEVSVDCDELARASETDRPLSDDDFTSEQGWTLARGDAVPLWDRRGGAVDRDCYAVILRARDRRWVVSWRHGEPPLREIDIRLERGQPAEEGAVVIAGRGEQPPRTPSGVTVRPRR